MRKTPLFLAVALAAASAGLGTSHAFNVISGSVAEIAGPDDLLLDPATAVIAIDTYGNGDSTVNDVTFFTDRAGLGAAVTAEGVVTSDGVTVTTGLVNQIDNWSGAAGGPAFTGGTPGSAAALSEIMRDIRWANANDAGGNTTLKVDITGLDPNTIYSIQMLFNEGADRDRRWDIAVDDVLAVDDFSSEGEGAWSANNSFLYEGEFDSGADSAINVVMGREPLPADPNNTAWVGADANAILQAVVVHSATPPTAPTDIILTPDEFAATAPIGTVVGVLSAVDVNGGDTHSFALVPGDGDTDNAKFEIDGNELLTAVDFSALAGNSFSFRIEVEDSSGLVFVKAVQATAVADADADGLLDTWELIFVPGLSELNGLAAGPGPGDGTGDFDGDGSSEVDEFANETDPTNPDSDDDGSNDGDEATNMTDPLDDDTDDDGLNDGDEATAGSDPLDEDSDNDTITDGDEVSDANGFVTDPTNPDTDGDSVADNTDPDPLDPNVFSQTVIFSGEVIEFTSPDDLHLDPATAVIAIDVFGAAEVDVNGVTFQVTDPPQNVDVGVVSNGGVTVTTTAINEIPGWAAAPAFTGVDAASATNLAEVMRSIRWQPAPGPVTIDIEGLVPDALYEIQLLFNEGGDRNRFWDISVEGEQVVDNISSEGIEAVHAWTPENSAAYMGEFLAPADGILNVVMQAELGGNPPLPTDNNPILQGVVVHLAVPPEPFIITDIALDTGAGSVTITWNSVPGANYAIDASTGLEPQGEAQGWFELDDGVIGEPGQTSYTEAGVDLTMPRFYRVRTL